jgi:hypothetical protein
MRQARGVSSAEDFCSVALATVIHLDNPGPGEAERDRAGKGGMEDGRERVRYRKTA